MKLLEGYSQKNFILIAIVVVVATSLSAVAVQFSNQTVNRINEVSISGIRANAEVQALDLSNSVANKLADTTGTLQLISNSPSITESNLTRAKIIMNQAQNSSGGLVDFYMWLND